MDIFRFDIRAVQRWTLVLTLALASCVLWINALSSGIAKLPLVVLGATLIAAFSGFEFCRKNQIQFSLNSIEIVVVLHVPFFVISGIATFNQVYTWNALSLGLACIVFFFAGSSLFRSKRELGFLLGGITLLTTVVCVVGLVQFFFSEQLPLDFFMGKERRIASLFGNANFFASYLILVFPLVLGQTFHQRSLGEYAFKESVLLASITFLVFTTQARSSIIALGVSVVTFLLLRLERRNARQVFGGLFAVLLFGAMWLFVVRPELGTRFTSMFAENPASTFARRTVFWEAGKDAFLASPVHGYGIGSFEQTILGFRSPEYWKAKSEDIVPHAHNELLEIAVEYGIVGVFVFLVTISLLLYNGIRYARVAKARDQWLAAGLVSSIVAISVDNLANVTLREAPTAALAWLLMGLLSTLAPKTEKNWNISQPMRLPNGTELFPLVAWCIFALWFVNVQLRKTRADAHVLQGIFAANGNTRNNAVREFQAALAENPKHLLGRSELSVEFIKKRQWNEALESTQQLQALSPLYPRSFIIRATALLNLQRYPEALTCIENEIRLRTHPEAYQVQASIYRALSNDTLERQALVNLAFKNIEGKTGYAFPKSSTRLFELSKTEREKEEIASLYGQLAISIPHEREFFERLRAESLTKK